jgi:glutamyl-Q tRNA(Asp) synthetase
MTIVTRFAPSPTGFLHLGHAYAALTAWRRAREAGGKFLLRIEDIDRSRCRPEFTAAIIEDLAWLGLDWDGEVRRQSEHFVDYRAALDRLDAMDLLYPCFCTRADIAAEIARAGAAPHDGENAVYPGICRSLSREERQSRIAVGTAYALRLDVERALRGTGPLSWEDEKAGRVAADPRSLGDIVVARRDFPASYHLAVTIDDSIQGVTLVTRGEDLFAATHIHRLLQALLDLPVPRWSHHPLFTDGGGKRLAKRDRAVAIRGLRDAGYGSDEVRAFASARAIPAGA